MRLVVVDAFSEVPFSGNPAAVAVLEAFPPERTMQQVAAELNLSETAFVVGRLDGDHDLRWFTPRVEVALCGHATLAAAHVLDLAAVTFHTRSGPLRCVRGPRGQIDMDLPADPVAPWPLPEGTGLQPVRWSGRGREDVLVEMGSAQAVRAAMPDMGAIRAIDARTVIVTAAGDRAGIDCVSRVFGPNVGVMEDPVTGSAHCTLAGYWGEQTGKSILVGEQASTRGGLVAMERRGNRVGVGGTAVTTATVDLLVA